MPTPGNLAFDDAVIDFAGGRLLRGGVEQALEPKAFAVLALLAGAPGRLFGRDEILDAVWGHRHVTPGVLNRVMTLLRHALGEDAQAPRYLHTVHGVGYRFDLPAVAGGSAFGPLAEAPLPSPPPEATAAVPRRRAGDVLPPALVVSSRMAPRKNAWAWLLLLAVPVVAVVGWRLSMRTPSPPARAVAARPAEPRSIAVLPLANASGDREQQFFSDGISENLIDTLSGYEGLKVIGRSSSFRFRDSRDDSRGIGAKLGVAYLVAGSVQRVGDNVRIGVEVVDTADGHTLWTQRFDRPYRNLFALQDEIALAVAGSLQGKLPHMHGMAGVVESGRPASGNLDAYSAFLRGAYFMLRDNHRAIEQFSEAIRLDPGYAQAWQWRGFVRAITARDRREAGAVREACGQADRDIETAIRLAPDYGLGYSALAVQRMSCDYDWNGALVLFRKAMPLVSDSSPVHGQYSRLLVMLGRLQEAIGERNRHLAGDPLIVDGNYWLWRMEASLGRLDDAEAVLRKLMRLVEPDDMVWFAEDQSYLAILRGDADGAVAEAKRLPPGRIRDWTLALALQAGNNRTEADAALRKLLVTEGTAGSDALGIARIHALRGDADAMFEWLDRDWERHGMAAYQVLSDPLLLRFRNDPRFAAFCRKVGLPPPTASDALDIDRIRAANARRQ